MSDVTRILDAIQLGDPKAADELLPLVYQELRRLAAHKMAQQPAGQTLQATALVHEAYLRLVASENQSWDHRGHFFAAAAEAMRHILVDSARRKQRAKHGGNLQRLDVDEIQNQGAGSGTRAIPSRRNVRSPASRRCGGTGSSRDSKRSHCHRTRH